MHTPSEILNQFESEFGEITSQFDVHQLSVSEAMNNGDTAINQPGVYVYWHPAHGVIKVGKSQGNSKKRALEHIQANTKNNKFSMESLSSSEDAKLILFNIPNNSRLHWILSLEAFFEWNLSPAIPAGRMG